MATMTRPTSDITRAAERYLEQYGDPLVMNTYLKVTILVLCAVCLALVALAYKSQQALANMHPMIVRINDVGRAEAIDYRNFQYRPQEAENKYYLTRWAELYFARNRFTIERDQTNALYFLNSDVQRAVIEQERKDNIIQNYVRDSTLPYVDVEVKNVVLDDLRQSPYSARVEFEKVYTNTADHTELKRERWTASVADTASARLWLADGFPLADVLTMLEVRRRFELSPDVGRAYAVEILSAARAEIHLANQPVIAHQKEIQNAAA